MSETRYIVRDGSNSGHCCFAASVLDTLAATIDGDGDHMELDGVLQYEAVCECFDRADAERIAALLNASSSPTEPTA